MYMHIHGLARTNLAILPIITKISTQLIVTQGTHYLLARKHSNFMIATIVSMSNPPEAKKQVYVDFNEMIRGGF